MPTENSTTNNGLPGTGRQRILDYLAEHGGRIESAEGRLTAGLAEIVGYRDAAVLSGMLGRLEREGLIERDVRGRRTFAIALRQPSRPRGRSRRDATAADVVPAVDPAPAETAAVKANGSGRGRGGRRRQPALSKSTSAEGLARLGGVLGEALVALARENESLSARLAVLESSAGGSSSSRRSTGSRKRG